MSSSKNYTDRVLWNMSECSLSIHHNQAYSSLSCALGSVLTKISDPLGYDSVLMIANTAKSISSAVLDLFCLLLASKLIFRNLPSTTLQFDGKGG